MAEPKKVVTDSDVKAALAEAVKIRVDEGKKLEEKRAAEVKAAKESATPKDSK